MPVRTYAQHLILAAACAFLPVPILPQIGGATAASGDFVLDDVEDLDKVADGVERDWISDTYTVVTPFSTGDVLQAIDPSQEGLNLASGQTPLGAYLFFLPSQFGFIDKSAGVPMPSIKAASTATNPGDITAFDAISFNACATITFPGQLFIVSLEAYPQQDNNAYPKMNWYFTPAEGQDFQPVVLELRSPDFVENAGTLTHEDMLSQTRFLSIYSYAENLSTDDVSRLYTDDITLKVTAHAQATSWSLYN